MESSISANSNPHKQVVGDRLILSNLSVQDFFGHRQCLPVIVRSLLGMERHNVTNLAVCFAAKISNLFVPIHRREQNGDTNRNPFCSPRAIAAVYEHQSSGLKASDWHYADVTYLFRRTRRQRSSPNVFLIPIECLQRRGHLFNEAGRTRRPALFIQPLMQGRIVRLKSVVKRASRLRAANEICDWTEIRMGCRSLAHSLSDRSVICRVMSPRGVDTFRFLLCQRRKNSWTSPGQLPIPGNVM